MALTFLKACVIPLVYLDFNLRHDFIVKNLCVNRDRPQLNCDGKCYLAKRIAAAQEQEQQEAERNFIFKLCETIADSPSVSTFSFGDSSVSVHAKNIFQYTCDLSGRLATSGVFHPPLAA